MKGDWTEQVKTDLKDFGIRENLDQIKARSGDSFKCLVKKHAKSYALSKFFVKKESHTKLDNLQYQKLEMQEYLRNQGISANQAKILLKYRTGMADYKGNYGAAEDCKLCGKHQDRQEEIFDCEVVTKISKISLKYEELFTLEIKIETARYFLLCFVNLNLDI